MYIGVGTILLIILIILLIAFVFNEARRGSPLCCAVAPNGAAARRLARRAFARCVAWLVPLLTPVPVFWAIQGRSVSSATRA